MPPRAPKVQPPKFQRVEVGAHHGETADISGRVRVSVRLIDRDSSRVIKGNISRTITVKDARVTDVANAIERALF